MSNTVISVENVSKQYHLGVISSGTFRDDFKIWWSKTRNKANPLQLVDEGDHDNREKDILWALKDVSFKVNQGEALGIIGRNGAGKSTLLKILSRVTTPTSGEIKVKGRIASLLEVGTGFHPELTGRENIYLNGAIMGMSRAEVARKFDEIVDFSGVEKFIDTPVKRYSSGMYVRLAFAVAAHLEPEILIVDEVLAVGDAEFQKKSLGKMNDVTKTGGRTVIFVSHNMQAIRQLCTNTIWINSGQIKEQGTSQNIVDQYLRSSNIISSNLNLKETIARLPIDPVFRLLNINLSQLGHSVENVVLSGESLDFEIEFEIFQRVTGLRVFFDLLDEEQNLIFRSFHDNDSDGIPVIEEGIYYSYVSLPANYLAPKEYYIRINAGIYNVRTLLPEEGILIPINILHSGNYNKAYSTDTIRGKLAPVFSWKTEKRLR